MFPGGMRYPMVGWKDTHTHRSDNMSRSLRKGWDQKGQISHVSKTLYNNKKQQISKLTLKKSAPGKHSHGHNLDLTEMQFVRVAGMNFLRLVTFHRGCTNARGHTESHQTAWVLNGKSNVNSYGTQPNCEIQSNEKKLAHSHQSLAEMSRIRSVWVCVWCALKTSAAFGCWRPERMKAPRKKNSHC